MSTRSPEHRKFLPFLGGSLRRNRDAMSPQLSENREENIQGNLFGLYEKGKFVGNAGIIKDSSRTRWLLTAAHVVMDRYGNPINGLSIKHPRNNTFPALRFTKHTELGHDDVAWMQLPSGEGGLELATEVNISEQLTILAYRPERWKRKFMRRAEVSVTKVGKITKSTSPIQLTKNADITFRCISGVLMDGFSGSLILNARNQVVGVHSSAEPIDGISTSIIGRGQSIVI